MSVESQKAPRIALAIAHKKDTLNAMQKHRAKCSEWLKHDPAKCLICRNVYDEFLIAARNLAQLKRIQK